MLAKAHWHEALLESGFHTGGVTSPRIPEKDRQALESWLCRGRHGEMSWLGDTAHIRRDPVAFHPTTRSVIVAALNTRREPPGLPGGGRIARYAAGRDYHRFMKKRLGRLQKTLARMTGKKVADSRLALDIHPVLERSLAVSAGTGWWGRQSQLVSLEYGPWLLLGEVFLPFELEPSAPITNRCGSCQACQDACPVKAIVAPGVVDSRRCISYWNIEAKGLPPKELRSQMGDWFFGCEACLEACPHGKNRSPGDDRDQATHPVIESWTLGDFLEMNPEKFAADLCGTPLRRPGMAGLIRNAAIVAANTGRHDLSPQLLKLMESPEAMVRAIAAWALGRLGREKPALTECLRQERDPLAKEEIESALASAEGPKGP